VIGDGNNSRTENLGRRKCSRLVVRTEHWPAWGTSGSTSEPPRTLVLEVETGTEVVVGASTVSATCVVVVSNELREACWLPPPPAIATKRRTDAGTQAGEIGRGGRASSTISCRPSLDGISRLIR
jgi:hypothetical protein